MFKVTHAHGLVRLTAQADFILTHATAIQQALLGHLSGIETERLMLDFSEIDMVDSVGIKLVLGLFRACQEKGIVLEVEADSPQILQVFQLCKLNQLLTIREGKAS